MVKHTAKKHSRKAHAKRTHKVKHVRSHRRKDTNSYGWEIVPFLVAVIVAIVVIVQSIDPVLSDMKAYRDGRAIRMHMAAGDCAADGGTLREIRGKERAVDRSIDLLTEAQGQLDWDCGMDAGGSLCAHAKANLEKVTNLVLKEQRELDQARVESCM